MSIPMTLDEAEGGGSLCLEAEVLQGDTRIDDKRVTVSLEPGASPGSSRARVRSTVAIDEPVVTVTLRAGCDTKSTRRFVLFADLPVEAAAVASAPAPAARAAESGSGSSSSGSSFPSGRGADAPSARSGTGSSDVDVVPQPPPRRAPTPPRVARAPSGETPSRPAAVAPPPPRPRVAASAPTVRPPARAPAPQVAAAPPPAPTPAPAAVPAPRAAGSAGGSRLQIDALEPTPSRDGELKSSSTLALPGTEDPGKRADAAAAWRAIATSPEDAARDAQRLQSLEATLNTLREQTEQNQRTLLALRSELTEARDSRYRNPLVYALIGLLLLALAAMALMWRALRRATAPAWYRDEREPEPPRKSQNAALAEPPAPYQPSEPHRPIPGSTFAAPEPEEEESPEAPPVVPAPLVMAHPAQRLVNTEELFDVQQQSDFFLSLGQHDQAIAVLRDHIAASPDTSALAYLDLLKIYHSLGRRDDYDRLRQDFLRNFNAGVPQFEDFEQAGRGLEHYGAALSRIEAEWPQSGTLPLIEELVFRKPGNRAEDSFDLAAYRELLLLYSVAKEVIDPDSAPPAPVTPLSYADTQLHSQLSTAPAPLAPADVDVESDTEAAPLEPTTAPAVLDAGPTTPTSLFASVEEGLHEETVMAPDTPVPGRSEPPHARPGREMDFTEVDRTAYETLPSPLDEPRPASGVAPEADPHVIDFELFDPATEAEIAPRKSDKKS